MIVEAIRDNEQIYMVGHTDYEGYDLYYHIIGPKDFDLDSTIEIVEKAYTDEYTPYLKLNQEWHIQNKIEDVGVDQYFQRRVKFDEENPRPKEVAQRLWEILELQGFRQVDIEQVEIS